MELGVWIMTIFTGLMGIGGIWAAIFQTPAVFESRKIAFIERQIGRIGTRFFVGVGGLLLVILAISFVALPPE